jgi:tetratricopeptide (TPR) repeat protein
MTDKNAPMTTLYADAVRHFEAGQLPAAEALLHELNQHGLRADASKLLARLLWLQRRRDEFDALCRDLLGDDALHFMGIELLKQSGQLDEALRSLANLPVTARKDLRFFLSAAWIYIEQGDAERAYDCAHPAFQADQSDATSDAYITSLLMTGRYQLAEELVAALASQKAGHCRWQAYQLILQRLLIKGADVSQRQLISAAKLPEPYHYGSVSSLNVALRKSVDDLQVFQQRPLDQSLEQGTQTAANLVASEDPALREFLALASSKLLAFGQLAASQGHDGLASVSDQIAINECWSVRLEGGRHRPHFHPQGVISGTYYLSVPPVDNKGSIYFGIPPFAIPDPLEPLAEVTPEEGLLILFPSYLFHGTRVAAPGYRRETLAFDAS